MSNAQYRLIPAIALTLSGLAASHATHAQNTDAADPSFTLNKVLVSATRFESNTNDAARAVAVVEKDQLDTIQPESVAQAVRYEPNVSMTGGPRSGNQGVNIRGLEGSKVLQVVDGVRQVFQSGHRPSYFLDPELLKSIEVVKGPASTLWGSGAVGGVVAQNTVSAQDLLDPNQSVGGFAKAGFNANNDKQTYTTALAGRSDSVDGLISGYYRDGNDLKQGNGDHLTNSAERDHGFLAKSAWQINDDQSLALIYRQSKEAGHVPSNGSADLGSSNFLIDRATDTQNATLKYALDSESELVDGTLSVYWNKVEMRESRVSDGRGDSTEQDVYGFTFNNQMQWQGVRLFYGLDGHTEDFVAQRSGASRPTPPEATTDIWGAYLGASIELLSDLQLDLGARYDDFATEAENLNQQSDDSDVSPSVALIWQASDAVQLTLRHDQAFRAPSSEELYTTGTHFCMGPAGCNVFVSNPDLKPEKARNTELLTRIQFAPNEQGGQWHFEGAVFENRVDDFIEQNVDMTFFPVFDPGTTTWRNVDKATIKGFEMTSTYVQDALTVKLSYGQTRGKDDLTDAYLAQIPADTKTFDASYAWLNDSLTTGLRVSDVSSQQRVNSGDGYDGYTLADLYASWTPAIYDKLKIDLVVNNVTDRHHRQAWQELYEPGREVILSTKLSF